MISKLPARFIPVDDACLYAAISRSAVYTLIRNNKVLARKHGARTLVDRASLDKYLDKLPKVIAR